MFISKTISAEERSFPMKHFVVMGVLDSLGNLIGTFPGAYLPPSINVAFTQWILPLNVVASFLFLGARYKWVRFVCCFSRRLLILKQYMQFFFQNIDTYVIVICCDWWCCDRNIAEILGEQQRAIDQRQRARHCHLDGYVVRIVHSTGIVKRV
jgi:hypothetical protein